jgi:hypothetical protein
MLLPDTALALRSRHTGKPLYSPVTRHSGLLPQRSSGG